MEKIKSSFANILLSLTCICLIAGVALSATNRFTGAAIQASKDAALQEAIQSVTSNFDNNPKEEMYEATADGETFVIYPAKKEGKNIGAAVESFSKNGFNGLIRIMVGFDEQGKLVNYSVLEHNETPGLGSKMDEWFRTDKNKQSVIGRDMVGGSLKVSKDGGDVDAITAATISSRAFLDAINRAYAAYSSKSGNDATSGATEKK